MKSWNAERRHILAWLVLPLLAVLNGLIRDTTYGRSMTYETSHAISVLPLLLAILLWAALLARRWPLRSGGSAVLVGAVWLAMTLGFEFGLGALQGLSVNAMLAEYDVTRGKVWPLIPFATLGSPALMKVWIGKPRDRARGTGSTTSRGCLGV